MADIDMSAYTGMQYNIIGKDSKKFTGTFDGGGRVVRNLTYATTASTYYYEVGLFGYTNNAAIMNLHLENVNLNGGYNAGGLICIQSYGTVTNCSVTGTITASSSYSKAAGLVASQFHGTITNCCSMATVTASSSSELSYCYAGGLVGYQSYGTITNSFNGGTITSSSPRSFVYAGGLVANQVNSSLIKQSYSTGPVLAISAGGNVHKGGLVGYSNAVCASCFWDTQTSGLTTSAGGTGKTTEKMKTLLTFTSTGWDFDTYDGDPADWMMLREGEDYPRLSWQTIYLGDIAGLYGVDTEDLTALIENWLEVWHVKADIVDDSIVNMEDLNALAAAWMQAGCAPIPCTDEGLAQDITGDGVVDVLDLIALADKWLFAENPAARKADIDNSGTVDLKDMSILAGNWMKP
jgi:hypothetical protein